MKSPSLLTVCRLLAGRLTAAELPYLKLKDVQAGGAPAAEAGQAVGVVAGKGAVFKTRNSWGAAENHDIQETELCRIYRIVTVLTPEEASQAAR